MQEKDPIHADLTRLRRELFQRVRPEPPPAEPLTTRQKHAVIRLRPIADRVARKVAGQWHAPSAELESVATEHLVEAVKRFDGRGNLDGFVGQWIRWRLLDYVRHRETVRRIEKSLPDNRDFRPRGNTDSRPGDFKRNLTNVFSETADDMPARLPRNYVRSQRVNQPSYPLEVREAAAKVRRNLDSRDVDILRHRLNGKRTEDVATLLNLSVRRVQELWADIEKSLRHHAREADVNGEHLARAVIDDKTAGEKFSKIFRAF